MTQSPPVSLPPAVAGARQWLGLAVLALPTLLLAMDVTVLYLAVPQLAADLRPTSTELLWITDSYGFLIAGFLVTMGNLGDRIGRRRLLLIGAAAFALASVLAAYATSPELLIAARAVLGIAGSTLMPSTLALISDLFRDPRQRGVAIGVWAACLSGGVALGPLVGGALLEWFWWGSVFLLAVPVMGLLLVTAPWLLPEHRDARAARLDPVSVALSLACVLLVIYGIKQLADGGRPDLNAGVVVLGVAVGAVFLRRQRLLDHPLIELSLFRARAFRIALAVMLFGMAAVSGTYLFVTLFLRHVVGLSPLDAGLWLLAPAAAMLVTSVLAPLLARRVPARWLVAASLGVSAAGFLLLTRLDHDSGLPLVVCGIVVVYLGQGPIMALGTDVIVGSVPPERAGAASALSETGAEFGLALGVAVLGSVATAVYRGEIVDAVPAGVPPAAADAARDTVDGAIAAAAQLPPGIGTAVLDASRSAFAGGVTVVAGIAAAITLALAVLAVRMDQR